MYIKKDKPHRIISAIKLVCVCLVITVVLCYAAYQVRGYVAVGGEWLVWMVIVALGAQEGERNEI